MKLYLELDEEKKKTKKNKKPNSFQLTDAPLAPNIQMKYMY